ncbi:hypothetical protein GCM10017691_12060 [Pseudonocardia petroleophila]
MAEFVGAVDQGTTSTRFMIFDHSGNEVGRHQLEHEQILPQAGWVEHNPVEIWERTSAVIQTGLNKTGLSASDLVALGITNQRETAVVWNKRTGRPLYNAIVWQDTRTDRIATALDKDGRGDVIRQKAGLPPATYFSGGKIQWILENVDGARELAESGDALFGNTDTWLIWQLTGGVNGGVHVTDPTNASRTMLMNLETLDWDDELLGFFGVPRSMLPEIKPSSCPGGYGTTLTNGPFGGEVLITGDLGDQQAATVGQVCFAPGEAKNTYGTGNFMLLNTGTELVRSKAGLLTTVGYKFGDEPVVYCLEGSIAVTGSAIQWLRDQLGIISGASESETLARQVEDNGGVYFVPAFSGLFAPYWRSDARGAIVGLSRATTPTPTWPGPRWRRSATRAATSPRRWRRTPGCTWRCSRSTAASPPTSCACRSRPTCSACRSAGPSSRRRRRWARRTRPGSPWASGRTRTSCVPTGTSRSSGRRSGRRNSVMPVTSSGRRPSSGRWTG